MSRLVAATLLAVLYLCTLGSTDAWDVAMAAVLGAVVGWWTVPPQGAPGSAATVLRRALGVPALVLATTAEIARGTWQVLKLDVGLSSPELQGVIDVPIGVRTELGIAVSGLIAGLSPGAVLVEVDRARGVMCFHLVDASDPDRARADLQRFYERYQRKVFP
jgi:multisubunit Na+/H+ antiporter MnhE subunit